MSEAIAVQAGFRVRDHVLVNGRGVGIIVAMEGLSVQVNFGPTHCFECGREGGDRIEWTHWSHIELTVGERDRREREQSRA